MATATANFDNSNTVTISSLASLANAATATSNAIDNFTDKFFSANIQFSIRSNATTSATGYMLFYLLRSADGGTTYDSVGVLIGSMSLVSIANSVTTIMTVSTEPYGPLGSHWKVAVENRCGQALNASSNAVSFTGVKYDIA